MADRRPLVLICTPGQAGDAPALPVLLDALRVPRQGPGRPRTTPDALLGERAYSARAHCQHLRARGITTVIPEPADRIGHRKNRGSRGGRPVNFDADRYRGRNVVERGFNRIKNWRGMATRYDKHVVIYRGAPSWPQYCSGSTVRRRALVQPRPTPGGRTRGSAVGTWEHVSR